MPHVGQAVAFHINIWTLLGEHAHWRQCECMSERIFKAEQQFKRSCLNHRKYHRWVKWFFEKVRMSSMFLSMRCLRVEVTSLLFFDARTSRYPHCIFSFLWFHDSQVMVSAIVLFLGSTVVTKLSRSGVWLQHFEDLMIWRSWIFKFVALDLSVTHTFACVIIVSFMPKSSSRCSRCGLLVDHEWIWWWQTWILALFYIDAC